MSTLSVLDSVLGSGLWPTVAGRDIALTVPGASSTEIYFMVTTGKNCATSLDLFEWKFDGRCGVSEAMSHLRKRALRLSEQCASESGFRRYGSRFPSERPRASLFCADYPSVASDSSLDLVLAAQEFRLPRQLSVDAHCCAAGVKSFADLRGPL